MAGRRGCACGGGDVECPDVAGIPGLLRGVETVPWPVDVPKKYVVYAGHAESTRLIADTLAKLGVPFAQIRGRREDKDAAREIFRDDPAVNVLLVTVREQCGGMHLPFASTLIFYACICDREVKAQAIARIHRIGREYSGECIELLNAVELVTVDAN